jgi:hypothetical protein
MRGTGEGHYAWDLQPQSTMTNANVEQTVAGVDGQTLTMKHKNGENKVIVTLQTTIVTYVPGDKSEIKPGTKVFIAAAKKQPDGSLQTPRINYGKDGSRRRCEARHRLCSGVNPTDARVSKPAYRNRLSALRPGGAMVQCYGAF